MNQLLKYIKLYHQQDIPVRNMKDDSDYLTLHNTLGDIGYTVDEDRPYRS